MRGTCQIKKKRGNWGDPNAWNESKHKQGGGYGGQQQGGGWGAQGGWGGQQQGGGWGGQQQGGGWGGQGGQQGGGWGGQQQGGWGGQQQGGWGGQQQGGGWGGQQQGGGWGGQQGYGGNTGNMGGNFANYFGNPGDQQAWGNDMQGKNWVHHQQQQQSFNINNMNNVNIAEFIEEQVIQLEPSPAQKTIEELRQKGQKFKDRRFPPNENSLSGEWGHISDWKSIKWTKISDSIPNARIFVDKPNPRDIKQGYLGDCYFLAGLAALAERPDRIFNLFLLDEVNDVKYYSVKILYKGKWMTVDMDEYIPYLSNAPAFSKSIDNQLWVMLLQKAWAKIYTSYKRTQAGYPEEPLHDLTGAPIHQIYTKKGSNKDQEWNYLMKASQLQYAMVCSSNPGSDSDQSQSGVVQGHAYTFLKVDILNFQGQQVKLVQLRNPWGKGEYKGNWSDYDQNWNNVNQAERQRIGFHPDANDGIFFIPWDTFWNEFRAITVAEIDDNASYVYKSCKDKNKEGAYFSVEVKREGLYSLQVDKTPERSFEDKRQNSYQYPRATLEIGLLQGGSVQKMKGFNSTKRTSFQKYRLQPGKYIVKVKLDFDPAWQTQYDVNLAVYAQYPCIINFATNQQACALAGQQVSWTGQDVGGEHIWNNMGAWGYNSQQGGWGDNSGGWGQTSGGGGQWGGNSGGGAQWDGQQGGGGGWGGQQGGVNEGWGGGQQGGGWGGQQGGGNEGWGGQQGGGGGWGGGQQGGGGWGGNNGW